MRHVANKERSEDYEPRIITTSAGTTARNSTGEEENGRGYNTSCVFCYCFWGWQSRGGNLHGIILPPQRFIAGSTFLGLYIGDTSQFVELSEIQASMHVRDEGNPDGPVLVLIHGGFGWLRNWEGWTKPNKRSCSSNPSLGDDYRLISIDLLGHGLTGSYPSNLYKRRPARCDSVDAPRARCLV